MEEQPEGTAPALAANDQAGAPAGQPDEADAKTKLAGFLARNPKSSVARIEVGTGKTALCIISPWGDASLAVHLPEDLTALAASLNHALLPERLDTGYAGADNARVRCRRCTELAVTRNGLKRGYPSTGEPA
jgi:hypothetical protein